MSKTTYASAWTVCAAQALKVRYQSVIIRRIFHRDGEDFLLDAKLLEAFDKAFGQIFA